MIGGIKEREKSSVPRPPTAPSSSQSGGFPRAQHRSKKSSAFLQSRQEQNTDDTVHEVPRLQASPSAGLTGSTSRLVQAASSNSDDIRVQISEENERRIHAMSEEEKQSERDEIVARFGSGIGDILRRAREARERSSAVTEESSLPTGSAQSSSATPGTSTPNGNEGPLKISRLKSSLSSDAILAEGRSTPSKKRTLRFADLKTSDVFVYESQPSSPKKAPIALLPPPPEKDSSIVSLPPLTSKPTPKALEQDDEGTPEDIRRRFFPDARADDPSLAWITSSDENYPAEQGIRYDLSGNPIPAALYESLPTHLGLHHHSGNQAGYTLDDLLLLSRSTVPAQRTAMMEVLAGVLRGLRTGFSSKGTSIPAIPDAQKSAIREKIVAVGIEALSARGTTAIRAAELIWEGVVQWHHGYPSFGPLGSVELMESISTNNGDDGELSSHHDLISTLPLLHILPLLTDIFKSSTLPPSSLSLLLQFLHRLALHSRDYAQKVLSTPDLLRSFVSCFLLTPVGLGGEPFAPDPLAIRLCTVLAESSREAATQIIAAGIPDSLLRFVVVLPRSNYSSTPADGEGQMSVLTEVLIFSRCLARYGLYSHVATTAAEPISALTQYIVSEFTNAQRSASSSGSISTSPRSLIYMAIAWLELLEHWMICAQDPHCTSPPHDILWSQISAWGWSDDILLFRDIITSFSSQQASQVPAALSTRLWAAIWNALAAWLEGSNTNGVRGGEEQKNEVAMRVAEGFKSGFEHVAIEGALNRLTRAVKDGTFELPALEEISTDSATLHSALRLSLALHPSEKIAKEDPPSSPLGASVGVEIPFESVHKICQGLVRHPVWSSTLQETAQPFSYAYLRPLTSLLVVDLRIAHASMQKDREQEWMRHALLVLQLLIPGDESLGEWILSEVVALITPSVAGILGWKIPEDVWERGGVQIIVPFLSFSLLPKYEKADGDDEDDIPVHISPYVTTPKSLQKSTRHTLPGAPSIRDRALSKYGLPIPDDWPFAPLNDLLRSGSSKAFSTLTLDWNASELDVVRATFVFAGLTRALLDPADEIDHVAAVFACIKVFMLEHGQKQEDSSDEVFRDTFVNTSMLSLLTSAKQNSLESFTTTRQSKDLETASRGFLGSATPFYQLYTDLVGLYDSISFSDPLFASMLLPPLSMRYAIDYRKLIWTDYAHIIRTIRIEPSHPIILSVRDYLWPIESNGDLVGAYLGALCRPGGVHGILRFIAIHHVACHVWADLTAVIIDTSTTGPTVAWHEAKAQKLFRILMTQAPPDVIREVALYRQYSDKPVRSPPHCYEVRAGDDKWRRDRMEHATSWGGDPFRERLQGLLR